MKITPSVYLYHAVLGACLAKGQSFSSWCRKNSINRENARAALYGIWRGPKSESVTHKIIDGIGRDTIIFLLEKREEAEQNSEETPKSRLMRSLKRRDP